MQPRWGCTDVFKTVSRDSAFGLNPSLCHETASPFIPEGPARRSPSADSQIIPEGDAFQSEGMSPQGESLEPRVTN
jgi:hypothetical protein